jgi:hypothetical protein
MQYFGGHECNADRVEAPHHGRVVVSPFVVSDLCNYTRRLKGCKTADEDDANRVEERLENKLLSLID